MCSCHPFWWGLWLVSRGSTWCCQSQLQAFMGKKGKVGRPLAQLNNTLWITGTLGRQAPEKLRWPAPHGNVFLLTMDRVQSITMWLIANPAEMCMPCCFRMILSLFGQRNILPLYHRIFALIHIEQSYIFFTSTFFFEKSLSLKFVCTVNIKHSFVILCFFFCLYDIWWCFSHAAMMLKR